MPLRMLLAEIWICLLIAASDCFWTSRWDSLQDGVRGLLPTSSMVARWVSKAPKPWFDMTSLALSSGPALIDFQRASAAMRRAFASFAAWFS
jgi:hypothetical protein